MYVAMGSWGERLPKYKPYIEVVGHSLYPTPTPTGISNLNHLFHSLLLATPSLIFTISPWRWCEISSCIPLRWNTTTASETLFLGSSWQEKWRFYSFSEPLWVRMRSPFKSHPITLQPLTLISNRTEEIKDRISDIHLPQLPLTPTPPS